ncbi:hypothetical protein ACF0H5_007934 [Mactra antiquata]
MVLQRAPERAILWGYASVINDRVIVLMNGIQVAETTVVQDSNNKGVWKVKLPAESKPGPFEINISSSEGSFSLSDVMFGDVWLCSGQSNMDFRMSQVNNSAAEIDDSVAYRDVRMLFSKLVQSNTTVDDVQVNTPWIYPIEGVVDKFSALCFMFGRNLQKHLGYPIGLIESSWGGTRIEVWSSPTAINSCSGTSPKPVKFPQIPADNGVLWNSMIHPYLSMTIKGAIWYQGESNSGRFDLYKCQFPAMINDWRQQFHSASDGETNSQFPFGFVQLAPYRNLSDSTALAGLRWSQSTNIGYVPNVNMPNTFMAVAIDLPDVNSPYGSVHPRYKQDIAARLALGARNVAYGEHNVVFQGPFPTSYQTDHAQNLLTITFDNGTSHLQVNSNDGFEVCCKGQNCNAWNVWTPSTINSHTDSTVSIDVSGCHGAQVISLRYLWRESPCKLKDCPLYSSHTMLPVPPFELKDLIHSTSIIG